MILSTLPELRLHLPANAIDNIESLTGFIEASEYDTLRDKLGKPLYKSLTEYYYNIGTEGINNIINSIQNNTELNPYDRLLFLAQRVVAFDAIGNAVGAHVVSINGAGINTMTADDYPTADKDRIATFQQTCRIECHKAINILLETLEDWAKDILEEPDHNPQPEPTPEPEPTPDPTPEPEPEETCPCGCGLTPDDSCCCCSDESDATASSDSSADSGVPTPSESDDTTTHSSIVATTTPPADDYVFAIDTSCCRRHNYGDVVSLPTGEDQGGTRYSDDYIDTAISRIPTPSTDDIFVTEATEIVNLWQHSRFYFLAAGMLIPSAQVLQDYLNIYDNREKFILMLPDIRYIQEEIIAQAIGEDFTDYLSDIAIAGTTNRILARIINRLRKAFAAHLEARTNVLKTESQRRTHAHDEAISLTDQLCEYLQNNQSSLPPDALEVFKTSPLYVATATGYVAASPKFQNNRRGNAFFATPSLR